ncbi:MAG: hypothetical protein V4717_22610 [Bacteroidota bacterium]
MKLSGKIILTVLLAGLIIGALVFYKTWNKPHRDVKDETAISVTAQSILEAYTTDEQKANSVYLDKAIEVKGEVGEITKTQQGKTVISLKTKDPMAGIRCTMKEDATSVTTGQNVVIKGICTGYLMDVTLVDCYVDSN